MFNFVCFLFLLAAPISQGQDYSDIRNCYFDYYYKDQPGCPDIQKTINCIQDIPSPAAGDQEKAKALMSSLSDLYQDLNTEWCPVLTQEGTCISAKINECNKENRIFFFTRARKITKLCSELQEYQMCLLNLSSSFDNKALNIHIGEVESNLHSCHFGFYKTYMEREECYEDMDKCMGDFYRFRRREEYTKSCKMIPRILKCLTGLKPKCHNPYLARFTFSLTIERDRCKEKMLPSVAPIKQKCKIHIDKCTYEFDTLFNEGNYSEACMDILGVGRCLEKLKPSCYHYDDLQSTISDTLIKCPYEYLKDVCNFKAIRSCIDNFFHDDDDAAVCSIRDAHAAINCLRDIKPYCTSDSHLTVINDNVRHIRQYCRIPE